MVVAVALEYRFHRTPNGHVWTQATFPYEFFRDQYLRVFDAVRVVARVNDVASVGPDWRRADGAGVEFAAVPHYIGPLGYARRFREIRAVLKAAVGQEDALIVRVPGQISTHLLSLVPRGRPYAVEVVSDPYDVFAPGSMNHPLRPYFRWSFMRALRRQCRGAAAAAYVTREALQRRYPGPADSVGISDVQIPPEALAEVPRPPAPRAQPLRLLCVGSLDHLYKSPDVQIDALAECAAAGIDPRLTIVGDGRCRPELEKRARDRGVADRVAFRGQLLAGRAVRDEMDGADLFLLPSRQEGLPRAMVEAMARAMPCIGSTVGGIPELLPPEDLVPPGDVAALAAKIREVVSDPHRMARMSRRNLDVAREYRQDVLQPRRDAFYRRVRERTEAWVRTRG